MKRGPQAWVVGALFGSVALPVCAGLAEAQRWTDRVDGNRLHVEWLKPWVKNGAEALSTSAARLSVQQMLGGGIALTADLPMAHFSEPERTEVITFVYESGNGSVVDTIGFRRIGGRGSVLMNPRIGIAFGLDEDDWSGEVGVRLPVNLSTGTAGAQTVGQLSDAEHVHAFVREAWTFSIVGRYRSQRDDALRVRGRVSGHLIGSRGVGNTTDLVTYRIGAGLGSGAYRVMAGLIGWINTDLMREVRGRDRWRNQIEGEFAWASDRIQASVAIRYWTEEDIRSVIPLVFVMGLEARY